MSHRSSDYSLSPRSSTSSENPRRSLDSDLLHAVYNSSEPNISTKRKLSTSEHEPHIFDLESVQNQGLDYSLLYHRGSIAYRLLPTSRNPACTSWKITNVLAKSDVGTIAQSDKGRMNVSLFNDSRVDFEIDQGKDFTSNAGNGGKKGVLRWRKCKASTKSNSTSSELECVDHGGHMHRKDRRLFASICLDDDNLNRGRIKVFSCGHDQGALDELIVTAWAMIVQRRTSACHTISEH